QVQAGAEVGSSHSRRRPRRTVRLGVVGAGVTADGDRRIGLVNDDGDVALLVVVVGAADEAPVRHAAGHVGEAGAEAQTAAGGRRVTGDADHRAGGAVRLRVIGAGVSGDVDRGVGLGDRVGDGAAGVVVVAGGVGEGPGVDGRAGV